MSTKFGNPDGSLRFLGSESLPLVCLILDNKLNDLYFSSRYLCNKYVVRMVSNYVVPAQGINFDWSSLFSIIGDLPLEFFSTRTVFTDTEGL